MISSVKNRQTLSVLGKLLNKGVPEAQAKPDMNSVFPDVTSDEDLMAGQDAQLISKTKKKPISKLAAYEEAEEDAD